jgi:O-antigen/teichoic acid export membrane protein
MTKISEWSYFKNIISVFTTKIFVLSFGLISTIILARALGPEGRGYLAAILIYPTLLVALTEGGMRQSAVFYLGQKKAADAKIIGALFSYILFAGLIGTVAVYMLMQWFGPDGFSDAMLLVAAAVLPLSLAVNALKGVFLGKEKIGEFNKATWIQKFFYVAGIALLYFFNYLTIFSAVVVTTLAVVFNLIQALYYLRINHLFSFELDFGVFKSMFKLGIVYALALFFIQANYKVDILFLSWLSTPDELGNYAVAVQVGELLWQLPAAVLVVLMSKSANSDKSMIVNTVCKTCRLTLLATSFTGVGLLIVSYFLIEPVFGAGFSLTFNMLLMLSIGLVLASVFKSINAYYAGQGNPYFTIYLMGGVVVVNIILNIIFIPEYGGVGAALASTISYSFSAIGAAVIFSKREGVCIKDILICKKTDFLPLINKLKRKRL